MGRLNLQVFTRAYSRLRERFEWKRNVRKLDVTRAGKGYIGLTIALGVTALATGNNAIYLVESLLLAGLILSGVVSERQISAVRVEFLRAQAKAGESTSDWVLVKNESKKTLFCLEIGEWKEGQFLTLAFFSKISGGETVRAQSKQSMPRRGYHRWEGFAVATSYPFGFAKKTKVVRSGGERLVWPASLIAKPDSGEAGGGKRRNSPSEIEIIDGEIRAYDWGDDARMIVANQSYRGVGAMVRNRRSVVKAPEVVLDVRQEPGELFELAVKKAATALYRSNHSDLILVHKQGKKRITGKGAALNALALIETEPS